MGFGISGRNRVELEIEDGQVDVGDLCNQSLGTEAMEVHETLLGKGLPTSGRTGLVTLLDALIPNKGLLIGMVGQAVCPSSWFGFATGDP